MALTNDGYEAWRDAIGAAWPEVIPNGIWERAHVIQVSYDVATGMLTCPYAVMVARFDPTGVYGVANDCWYGSMQVFYVAEIGQGDNVALRERLEALVNYLRVTPLSVGQIHPREPAIDEGNALIASNLLDQLNATQNVGCVTAQYLLGTSPSTKASPFMAGLLG